MAKDYKHRVQQSTRNRQRYPNSINSDGYKKKPRKLIWRWLLVIFLVIAFIVSLSLIGRMLPTLVSGKQELAVPVTDKDKTKSEANAKPANAEKPAVIPNEEPRYDFYTILPQAETVVPDYEIKSRVREELVGKSKSVKYSVQAGSFRDTTEAERHKAKLALLGIESRIEKAKVDTLVWYRVKIGPYDNPSSVSTIKDLLQKNGIGVVVTEVGQ